MDVWPKAFGLQEPGDGAFSTHFVDLQEDMFGV
jgi:hypothetical protein